MKCGFAILLFLLTSSAWGANPVEKILKDAGAAGKAVIKKTGDAVTGVADKVSEPIRNPRKAVSTWFDYNPAIERGERKNYNILPLFVSSPERGQGFGVKYAQESLFGKKDVIRVQAVQTLKNKSCYEFKYEFPPNMFHKIGAEFEASFENYTKFYYGAGNESQKEDESEYVPEFASIRLPLLYGITDHLSAGLILNYENWHILSIGQNGILPRDLPGLIGKDGARLYATSLLMRWDNRDSKSDPTKGVFF